MSWLIILLLIIGGLSLLILELLVVPGTTVVGVIGFILMSVGVWQSYAVFGSFTGTLVLISTLILSVGGFYLSLRSNTWKKAGLEKSILSKVNTDAQKLSVGDEGITTSRLNPMGKAFIKDDFFEVSTFGEFIDNNIPVKIVAIDGNKVMVEKSQAEKGSKKQKV
jgi:membrane-bound ClpP family serine protease